MFFKLSVLLGTPFVNNHDLKKVVIEPLWLGIVYFPANAHMNKTSTADTRKVHLLL